MGNIQVFPGFANFYWRFIQNFSKIAGPLTLMLITTRTAENLLLSLMAKDAEIVSKSDDCKDETVKRSLSKN